MAPIFILASFYLGFLVTCLSSYRATASLEIKRGQHDTFRNLRCQTSQLCTSDQCQSYRAECVDNNCEQCRCSKNGRNTFLTSGVNTGNCTRDESVISESRCETFADGSSMVIVNVSKFDKENSEKEIDLKKPRCSLLANKLQYLYNDKWKKLKSNNSSVAIAVDSKVSLQWNLKRTPKTWRGLMVKVQFKCEETNGSDISKTEHCVVIKYTGTFKGFNNNKEEEKIKPQKLEDPTNDNAGNIKATGPKSKQEINNNFISKKKRNNKFLNKNTVIVIWVCDFGLFCIAAMIGIVSHKTRSRLTHLENLGTENSGQNPAPLPPHLNEGEPSTSNQSTQEDSEVYEILNERLYECVDKTTFTSPQPFNHDTSGNGSLRSNHKQSMELEKTRKYVIQPETEEENAHDGDFVIKYPDTKERDIQAPPQTPQYEIPISPQYEYPYHSQSHQYECPSLNNKEADTRGRTNACAQDSAYAPSARPPLNKNERENEGDTSLNKEEKISEKGDATAKRNEEDELLYVYVTNSDCTPLVSQTLKDNESENGGHTSLINEQQTSEKGDTTAINDKEDELFYADAKNGNYTPLVSQTLKENENGGNTSLIKEEKTSEKGDAIAIKDKEDELFYADATSGNYTPLVSQTLKETESENGGYTSLIKEEKTSEEADTTAKKDKADELLYVDVIDSHYTPLAKSKHNESEVPVYQPLLKKTKRTEETNVAAKAEEKVNFC